MQAEEVLKKDLETIPEMLGVLSELVNGGLCRFHLDDSYSISWANHQFYQIYGYTDEKGFQELHPNSALAMVHPDDLDAVIRRMKDQYRQPEPVAFSCRALRSDGEILWIRVKGVRVANENGYPTLFCAFEDITNEKTAKDKADYEQERYRILLEQSKDIIFEYDVDTDHMQISEQWENVFGYRLPCRHFMSELPKSKVVFEEDLPKLRRFWERAKSGISYNQCEIRVSHIGGDENLWCLICATTLYESDKNPYRIIGKIVNIDAQKREHQTLIDKSKRDSMTHLYNNGSTRTLVEEVLKKGGSHAMMILDIDNFKQINDRLGHLFGDAVLKEVSSKIQRMVRSTDIIGRIGGDEFLIFLQNIANLEQISEKASAICRIFQETDVGSCSVCKVSCSVGISVTPNHGVTYGELFHRADTALYTAKQKGKNRFEIYSDSACLDFVERRFAELSERERGDKSSCVWDSMVTHIFEMLFETQDLQSAITVILRMVGKQFSVSRAYIYENEADSEQSHCTYEWCAQGIPSLASHCHNTLPLEEEFTRELFGEDQIFYCDDIEKLDKNQRLYHYFHQRKTISVIQAAILDEGMIRGIIAFEDCKTARVWTKDEINVLSIIAKILAVFLIRLRVSERHQQQYEMMQMILENQRLRTYMVNPKTYRLFYLDEVTQAAFPSARVGQICYQVLNGRRAPCENCPMERLQGKWERSLGRVYNPKEGRYSNLTATKVHWHGYEACLLCRSSHD